MKTTGYASLTKLARGLRALLKFLFYYILNSWSQNAFTKMAQTQSNVNHHWRESEFAENKCPNKVVHSETKKSYQQCCATQLSGLAVGREDGQLQQLCDQAKHHLFEDPQVSIKNQLLKSQLSTFNF